MRWAGVAAAAVGVVCPLVLGSVVLGSVVLGSAIGAAGATTAERVTAGATAATKRCAPVPTEIRLQVPGPSGATIAGFEISDAVARRVPIVPQTSEAARDPAAVERLQARAAKTKLALYSLYLADFRVPRDELSGFGFGDVRAPAGKTVAVVTIVPTEKAGFAKGDVVEEEPFRYDLTTTFAPLSLTVNTSGQQPSYSYDTVTGHARIRALDARSICLEFDVAFSRAGQQVAAVAGSVRSPVVKSSPSFFYT